MIKSLTNKSTDNDVNGQNPLYGQVKLNYHNLRTISLHSLQAEELFWPFI